MEKNDGKAKNSYVEGEKEIREDYERYLSTQFEKVSSSLLVQNFQNNVINYVNEGCSQAKVASILDIVETHVFSKVDEEIKGKMIMVFKPWAHRLLQIRQINTYLVKRYCESL